MTLPLSGNSISLSNIALEFSDSSPYKLSEFYRGSPLVPSAPPTTANIPTSGTIRFSNFYGAAVSARISLTLEFATTAATGNSEGWNVYAELRKSPIFPSFVDGITDLTVNVQSQVHLGTAYVGAPGTVLRVPAPLINPGNKVTLNVHGVLVGGGGPGGPGATGLAPGGAGLPGGVALRLEPVTSPNPSKIVNINVFPTGGICGGGGGGGGGGPRSYTIPAPPKGSPTPTATSGGGGGGGARSGPGGPGYFLGSPGTPTLGPTNPGSYPFGYFGGAGGSGGSTPTGFFSGAGGPGGALGSSGTPGSSGSFVGGTGGTAGSSITGTANALIPASSAPRIYGPQSPT